MNRHIDNTSRTYRFVPLRSRCFTAGLLCISLLLVVSGFPLTPAVRAHQAPDSTRPETHTDTAASLVWGDWDAESVGMLNDVNGQNIQIRVLYEAEPVADALVYRLAGDQEVGGAPLTDDNGQPLRTDEQGYLQGDFEVAAGDQLFAMAPITWTDSYTMYYTSGMPGEEGVTTFEVTQDGEQELTVSEAHPLVLFNLYVSLEWDASNDPTYLQQLEFNLQRTSQYLYDITNGQAALGEIEVSQNADDWAYSHIVVHASNNLRPYAAQGGVVITPTVDPAHDDIVYDIGQVAIGATWNRYGDPGHNLGDDWPIILAHELGHFLFFQDEVYLGLNEEEILIAVDSCVGSVMGDPYTDMRNTEFIADDAFWHANCAETLANQSLMRDEWETLTTWYPQMHAPEAINAGPSMMPFDLTSVAIYDPITPTNALEDPTFYLDYEDRLIGSSEARAYILRDDYVVDMGSPIGGQNRVLARGAQPGDELCVFDRALQQYGCETIELGDDRLSLERDATWAPVVQISPVTSTTIDIRVNNLPPGLDLHARLYPEYGPGEVPILLSEAGDAYEGTFHLEDVAMAGNIRVWVDEPSSEDNPRRETMIAYSIGGNPGRHRGRSSDLRDGGGRHRGRSGRHRGRSGRHRGRSTDLRTRNASLLSSDGQMFFFSVDPLEFDEGEFYTLQDMAGLPPLPPGRTVIGQGYSLVTTPGAPVMDGSISFEYMGNDVIAAGGDETTLTVYYWDGATWTALPTVRDPYYNMASARSQGSGIYVLMSSVEIALEAAGWNLIAYPVKQSRSVPDALKSIDGYYTQVMGYDATSQFNPWRRYIVGLPAWLAPYINNLHEMEFGKGYFVYATEELTLYLPHDSGQSLAAVDEETAAALASMPQHAPASYYGIVQASDEFMPAADMPVVATVNGTVCGQGFTQEVDGNIIYAVEVYSDEPGIAEGCGATGRMVSFQVGDQMLATTAQWDSSQVNELNLSAEPTDLNNRVYIPMVVR